MKYTFHSVRGKKFHKHLLKGEQAPNFKASAEYVFDSWEDVYRADGAENYVYVEVEVVEVGHDGTYICKPTGKYRYLWDTEDRVPKNIRKYIKLCYKHSAADIALNNGTENRFLTGAVNVDESDRCDSWEEVFSNEELVYIEIDGYNKFTGNWRYFNEKEDRKWR